MRSVTGGCRKLKQELGIKIAQTGTAHYGRLECILGLDALAA